MRTSTVGLLSSAGSSAQWDLGAAVKHARVYFRSYSEHANFLHRLNGGTPWLVANGWAPSRWSRDGKRLYVEVGMLGHSAHAGRTAVLDIGAGGLPLAPIMQSLAGATVIPHGEELLSPESDRSFYVFVQSARQRNIYRIPLH